MERKFKIGDIVIGNSGANMYGITIEGYKARVVDNLGFDKIRITSTLEGPYNKNYFDVEEIHFDLFKKCVNNQDELLKEALERYPIGTRVSSSNILEFGCEFTIKSTKFHYESNNNIVRYDSPSIGSYIVFEKGKWADVIPKDKPDGDSPHKFKVGDKVEISETSIYRYQGYNSKIKQKDSEKGLKMVGTIVDKDYSSLFEYVVSWPNKTRRLYRECDLVPHNHESSKPLFKGGDKVMIRPSSRYINQGYRNGEKLIGNVTRVYGSDPIYYVVVWSDHKKGIYEDKDLEPYLHEDKNSQYIVSGFESIKSERLELRELEDPDKYKFIKKTASLDFQEPVIVKKTTGNKFKLITII